MARIRRAGADEAQRARFDELMRDRDLGIGGVIAGSARHVDYFDLPVEPIESPSPGGLVRVAAPSIHAGAQPDPLEPLDLRRPDAVARQV